MTFKDRQLNFITCQAWKMKFLNSTTSQVFHDLYEPWISGRVLLFFAGGATRRSGASSLVASSSLAKGKERRDFKIPRRRRQRELQKSIRLNRQNNTSARASRFFVHFFTITARLRRQNAYFYFTFYGGSKQATAIFSFSS